MAEIISAMAGVLLGILGGMLSRGQLILDRVFPPEKQDELWEKLSKFANEKPMLASFIFSQIALSGFPLGFFIITTTTVVVFSLVGALLIGLLGALTFIAVVDGFALLILLPVLFVTTFAAAFIWMWGVGGYYILKWFNKKEMPGINAALPEGMSLEESAVEEQGGKSLTAEETPAEDYHTNGDSKHVSSKGTSKSTDYTTYKDDDRRKSSGGNVVGNTVTQVPSGSKGTDTTKAVGVDIINWDPTKDPSKVVDAGKVTGKREEAVGRSGDASGKVLRAERVGDVGGKVKGGQSGRYWDERG